MMRHGAARYGGISCPAAFFSERSENGENYPCAGVRLHGEEGQPDRRCAGGGQRYDPAPDLRRGLGGPGKKDHLAGRQRSEPGGKAPDGDGGHGRLRHRDPGRAPDGGGELLLYHPGRQGWGRGTDGDGPHDGAAQRQLRHDPRQYGGADAHSGGAAAGPDRGDHAPGDGAGQKPQRLGGVVRHGGL